MASPNKVLYACLAGDGFLLITSDLCPVWFPGELLCATTFYKKKKLSFKSSIFHVFPMSSSAALGGKDTG